VKATRTTIYLPTELHHAADLLALNVSSICQYAIRAAIVGKLASLNAAVEAGEAARAELESFNANGAASWDEQEDEA